MRTVAGEALAVFHRLMFYFRRSRLLFEIIVAIETKLAVGFNQQPFVIGAVRVMAGGALAVLHRLMLEFGRRCFWFVAFQAQGGAGLCQHLRVGRPMRIMAGGTFAFVRRLMFEFYLGQEIVVARETNLLLGALHLHRKTRLMAFTALLVLI